MYRQRAFVLGLSSLFAVLLLLPATLPTSGAMLVEPAIADQDEVKAKSFPTYYDVNIELQGSEFIRQADIIKIYVNGTNSGSSSAEFMTGSAMKSHYEKPGQTEPLVKSFSFQEADVYRIEFNIYNSSYDNGTPRTKSLLLDDPKYITVTVIGGGGSDDDDGTPFTIDTRMLLLVVVALIVVVGIGVGVKVIRDRGGIGLGAGSFSLPSRTPAAKPGAPGTPSPLGGAHGPDAPAKSPAAGQKGPVAKRDCPGCGTAIPIESDERPLRLTCPNPTCKKSFTLKGKSGAVGPTRPPRRRPGRRRAPPGRKPAARGRSAAGRKPPSARGKPRPGAQRPKPRGAGGPPKPKTRPPKPKAKPLHCPNDGGELQHYPGAAKEHGYDSDYFCSDCELYVQPKEQAKKETKPKAKAKTETKSSVAGPFGGEAKAEEKKEAKADVSESGTITCPSCRTKHDVPEGQTKSITCSCGRRIRPNRT